MPPANAATSPTLSSSVLSNHTSAGTRNEVR
jgi:hypothetical protein